MLFFIVALVFHGDAIFGFVDTLSKEIELGFIKTTWANIMGLVLFLMLHFTKAIVLIAKIMTDQLIFIKEKVIPMGILIAIIVAILGIVALILLQIYAPQVLKAIHMARKAAKKNKADNKEALNRQVLDTIVHKATERA